MLLTACGKTQVTGSACNSLTDRIDTIAHAILSASCSLTSFPIIHHLVNMTTPIAWQYNISSETYDILVSDSEPKYLQQELDQFWSDYVVVVGERLKREGLMYLTLVIDSITGVMTVFAETRLRLPGTAQPRVYVFFPWLERARKSLFDDYFEREEAGLENSHDDERKLSEMDRRCLEEHAQAVLAAATRSHLAGIAQDKYLLVRLFFGNGEGVPVHEIDLINPNTVKDVQANQ